MKDSKIRIQIPVAPDDRRKSNGGTAEQERACVAEGTNAKVLEWNFPAGDARDSNNVPGSSGSNNGYTTIKTKSSSIKDRLGDSPTENDKSKVSSSDVKYATRTEEDPFYPKDIVEENRWDGEKRASQALPADAPAPGGASDPGRTFRVRPGRFGRRGYAARRPGARGRRVRVHPAVWAAAGLLALALAVPLLVVAPGGGHKPAPLPPGPAPAPSAAPQPAEEPAVSVYLTRTDTVETLPLESYLVGVLAAEMPAEFQLEALKAQAIAARTFIVRRLKSGDRSGVPEGKGQVTDTVAHQAYISKEKLEKDWAAGKEAKLEKLRRAVKETKGIVMTYKGEPITASFFSTSNGYTENSEDYWKNEIPYLRSVESPWDKQISPKYKTVIDMPHDEFIRRLGLSDAAIPVSLSNGSSTNSLMKVISYTQGNRIQEARVGGKKFTGREIREKLDLRSSQFSWRLKGGNVEIVTYGNGHGVGMSQYGAEGMAREGYKAKEILRHYYTGISFAETSKLLSPKK